MVDQYTGDVTPAPDFTQSAEVVDDELLFSTARFTQKGVTLAEGQGVLPMGTVVGRVTSTKLWKVYANGNSDGTEVARGVLRRAVDTGTGATARKMQGNIVISGILKNDKLSGMDSNAVTDFNGRQDTVLNTFTF